MKKIILPLLLSAGIAGFSNAEPFVVQGQLRDNGSVANGLYDFEFELWDAVTGGNQVGITLAVDDLDVVAGVFTSEIDFGAVFNGNSFWVETRIRAGGSIGPFSPLPSRILIGSAPQAHHATTADSLINPQWNEAPGVLWYGSGSDQVFINRSNPILSSEVFGVQTNSGFSGIVVSGPSSTDSPYIALATNNSIDAYQWYNGANDNWVFWKSGAQRFFIDAANVFQMVSDAVFQGDVDIDGTLYANSDIDVIGSVTASSVVSDNLLVSGDISSDSFNYNIAQARFVTISVWDFSDNGFVVPSDFTGVPQIVSVPYNFSAVIRAYVNRIPQGARIVDIEVVFLDNSTRDDLVLTMLSESILTGTQSVLAQTVSSGNFSFLQTTTVVAMDNTIVDNEANIYILDMNTVDGVWSDIFLMGIRAVIIHYEVNAPE
jgi:hypothetical protein